MNWFKETWWLVKQLFTTTKNKDKVQYKHMDHYPFSGYSFMNWMEQNAYGINMLDRLKRIKHKTY